MLCYVMFSNRQCFPKIDGPNAKNCHSFTIFSIITFVCRKVRMTKVKKIYFFSHFPFPLQMTCLATSIVTIGPRQTGKPTNYEPKMANNNGYNKLVRESTNQAPLPQVGFLQSDPAW